MSFLHTYNNKAAAARTPAPIPAATLAAPLTVWCWMTTEDGAAALEEVKETLMVEVVTVVLPAEDLAEVTAGLAEETAGLAEETAGLAEEVAGLAEEVAGLEIQVSQTVEVVVCMLVTVEVPFLNREDSGQ